MEHNQSVERMENRLQTRELFFLIGYTFVVSICLYLLFSGWAYDDPFITYRYAENLVKGLGFIYNPGERVLSTTSPLFAIGLAPIAYTGEQLPRIAVLIGAISLALGGLLIWDLGRTWNTPMVQWSGLLLYPTFPLLVMTLGSETPLYLTLSMGTFNAYIHKRYPLAGLLAAMTILTRPDGFVLVAILASDFLLRRLQPIPWKAIAIITGLLIAWIGFAWIYFGSPVPVTLAAKQHQGSMAISQRFAAGFLTIARGYLSWPYLLEAIVAIAGVAFAVWQKRGWLLFLAWPIIYFVSYSILGVSRYFWYYAPLVPGFIVCIGLGVTSILFLLGWDTSALSDIRSRWFPVVAAILLGVFYFGQGRSLLVLRRNPDQRVDIYQAVGEWLEANTESGDKIGALEVGIIGYYAKRPMVDFAGLIQPQVAAQLRAQTTYEDAAFWAVERFHPEYIVLQEGLFPRLEMNYINKSCEVVKIFRGEKYGYPQNLNIYVCDK